MTPIVIDLEWNQPMRGALPKEGLNGEIIQLGAAKIDMDGAVLDTFSVTIKPQHYRWMNKDISKLTQLTTEDINNGIPLKDAVESFKTWCGEEFSFISWGPEDYYMLKNNLEFFEMDSSWLPETFDAQLMFDDMETQEDRQYPLNYALWYFKEKPNGMHNALADVISTTLILKHLDLNDGLTDDYFRCDDIGLDEEDGTDD